MRRFEEIESGIEAVLADDGVDDFLVECRDHQPDVEFADLDPHGMLYNVASLSDDLLKDELDRRLDIQEVERGEMYVTFAYYGERSPGAYADVFETILTTLDAGERYHRDEAPPPAVDGIRPYRHLAPTTATSIGRESLAWPWQNPTVSPTAPTRYR